MTPEERDEIRARNEKRRRLRDAATAGPWRTFASQTRSIVGVDSPGKRILSLHIGCKENDEVAANGKFIAHARSDTAPEDIDALLAEVERLTAENAKLASERAVLMRLATM